MQAADRGCLGSIELEKDENRKVKNRKVKNEFVVDSLVFVFLSMR